jgi:hypothetical protein
VLAHLCLRSSLSPPDLPRIGSANLVFVKRAKKERWFDRRRPPLAPTL